MEQQQELPIWRKYVDDRYDVYYVDYRDSLDGHADLLQECVSNNNMDALDDALSKWWDFPEEYIMDEIHKNMVEDGLEDEYEDNYDAIRDWVWEHDESTPIDDLLQNTGSMAMFYDLGENFDGLQYESMKMTAYKIRRKLKIRKDAKEAKVINEIIANSYDGGALRIYFDGGDIRPFINYKEKSDDFKTIKFKGTFNIGLIDFSQGCGWYEPVELDLELPFNRENLFFSKICKYNVEGIFGTYNSWCKDCDFPELSYDKPKSKKRISRSSFADHIQREAEYEKTYRSGKCTLGDMRYTRHRDVYYINSFPCGSKCPHCGTFWID